MIKPNKFLDLDSCIINISGEITKILLQRNSIKYRGKQDKNNIMGDVSASGNAPFVQ